MDTGTAKYDNVSAIAAMCPIIGGEAVYIARGMMIHQFGYITWADDSICNPSNITSARRAFYQSHTPQLSVHSTMQLPVSILIYPNPTEDLLNMDISDPSEVASVEIQDAQGRVIYSQKITSAHSTMNMYYFAASMYFVKFRLVDGSFKIFKISKV